MVIQIFKGNGVQPWRVRLVASNGEPISISEGYFSKSNATRAAKKFFPTIPIKYVDA